MRKDLILVAIIVATLTLMIIPLSPAMMDFLLAMNISLGVLLVIVALYLPHPTKFSTFPSVILIGTAFRLSLSIATTRLILSEADAGQIIATFGEFVVQGSMVIGLVIFLIITVVQFLVITKGAERVAEVAARFALDAMPGRQMSIDAEMRNGAISAEEASERRNALTTESQFFGAMDGAMKFIKGDAIAGLIIIFINLLGGIAVGTSQHGFTFGEAVNVYSLLTIGDGLVAQIPALLMSFCAGIVVTRVENTEAEDLGSDIIRQLVSDPKVPGVAAGIVIAFGALPGFPTLYFAIFSGILVASYFVLRRAYAEELRVGPDGGLIAGSSSGANPRHAPSDGVSALDHPQAPELSRSDRLRVLVGPSLAQRLDHTAIEQFIEDDFQRLYLARGAKFPKAHFAISPYIEDDEVVVELDEVPVFRTTLSEDTVIIMDANVEETLGNDADSAGLVRLDWPNCDGFFAPKILVPKLKKFKIDVFAPERAISYLAFRLYEQNIGTLFSQVTVKDLIATAEKEEPEIMALVRDSMTDAALYKLFRYLVEDGVPLRPLSLLIPSLHYWIHSIENPNAISLAECLRGSMKRQLCHRIAGSDGILGLVMIDPQVEQLARKSVGQFISSGGDPANEALVFEMEVADDLLGQFESLKRSARKSGRSVCIVASPDLRRRWRNYLATNNLHFPVLAPHEVSNEFIAQPVDMIRLRN